MADDRVQRRLAAILAADAIDPEDNLTRCDAACTYALLGEPDQALDLLEHWIGLAGADEKLWFKHDPDFDPLKDNPRYQRLLQLVEHPTTSTSQQGRA